MLRPEIWLISTLFCFGIIAGMIWSWPNPPASTPSAVEHEESSPAEALLNQIVELPEAQLQMFQDRLASCDRLLLAGSARTAAHKLRALFR